MLSVIPFLVSLVVVSAQVCTPTYGGHSKFQEYTAPDLFTVNLYLVNGQSPVVIEVNRSWSPIGADHFYTLLKDGYFDCAAFYHVNTTYAQTGIAADKDYTTKWSGYIEDDELSVVRQSNAQFTISYVPLDGHGTRSTHFMIHFEDNSYLDNLGYYPFAQVVDGFDALEAMKPFVLTEDEEVSYAEGGNDWLLGEYTVDEVQLINTLSVQSSSSGGGQDRSGSWAFGIIMTVLSSAGCIMAAVYIVRYIRKQQGYDTMSLDDSASGSSDRVVSLNLQQS